MFAALAMGVLHLAGDTGAECKATLKPGMDYFTTKGQTNAHADSVADCCDLCSDRTAPTPCLAFTFRPDQKQCWMKGVAENAVPHPNATAGAMPAPSPCACVGEFTPCPGGSCTMGECGVCSGEGEYLCPSDQRTCVQGPAGYAKCPGMAGTHLDATLPLETRLDFLVKATSLEEQIAQLTNKAPAIERLGIPSYNWLNDDQHGVGRTSHNATVLPNGCGMGATFSKRTIAAAGRVVGTEARGLHNFFLHENGDRGMDCNGCGITAYAPNLNLVRDPR